MEQFIDSLRKEERITLRLRQLYERLNYRKFRMRKFEEYQLYADNKNFLKSENVITFHDLDGRLMALKPDVTLSIVKNTKADLEHSEKLYYIENVYRLSRHNHEYREISQMGLEYIGRVDEYAALEVAHLAMESLKAIDQRFVLEFSHMGFISGLLDNINLDSETRGQVIDCIRSKNAHELKRILAQSGVSSFYAGRIERLPGLYGGFEPVLKSAREIAVNDTMAQALDELQKLYAALSRLADASTLRLDFSLINDIDYYNGMIFQGYVEKVPQAVLSGGRYDLQLRKMGKQAQALGFALYLDELNRCYPTQRDLDVDVLALRENGDEAGFAAAVWALCQSGLSVRAENEFCGEIRYKKLMRYQDGALREVNEDA